MSNISNEYENAELGMPTSDFVYYLYRKALFKFTEKMEDDLNTDPDVSGMILLATRFDDDTKVNDIKCTCFGNYLTLIDVMIQTIIKTINELTDDTECRRDMLHNALLGLVSIANRYWGEDGTIDISDLNIA